MSRRKGNGAPHAPASAATAEPAIYYKTPVTPEEAFQAIGRLRKEARDEIDRLIRFLDETDNHMEREQDGDEDEDSDPAEFDIPDEDSDPAEPSLGSVSNFAHSNQERWSNGSRRDFEQDDAESGIADQDGLDEQVPFRDWQNVGMV
jgi:hypothetical protein